MQYPHRRGWHTDQSYRRPPPDISLFLAVKPVARERGQTLFADGTLAYEALPPALKARVDTLEGLHAGPAPAAAAAMLAGETPPPSRRTSARSASRWRASIRSPAGGRSISASAARWTGWTARSSACSPARTATAPRCSTS